jgi:hypothetical protein
MATIRQRLAASRSGAPIVDVRDAIAFPTTDFFLQPENASRRVNRADLAIAAVSSLSPRLRLQKIG